MRDAGGDGPGGIGRRSRDRDTYTVVVSPSAALAGSSTTFDVALTNTSDQHL
jgi:hypothetical protein